MALSPLRAGNMRDVITVQTEVITPDGGGGRKRNGWSDVGAPMRAQVEPLTYGEAFKAGVERRTQFYRIRTWYRDGIEAGQRVMLGTIPLRIVSAVDPTRRRRELEITAESGAAQG